MLLKRLVLHNFGTYAGSQELNLQTTSQKTVILIGGKNGAGKSTLLEAIRLCFHG
jgi:DNA sulfur modification protein DndD